MGHAGHSLGGALATLAAYDLRQSQVRTTQICSVNDRISFQMIALLRVLMTKGTLSPQAAHNVMCITFGAPHVGNHTFVQDYNRLAAAHMQMQINGPACMPSDWLAPASWMFLLVLDA